MNTKFNTVLLSFSQTFFLYINYHKKLHKKVTQQNQPVPKTIQFNEITYSYSSYLEWKLVSFPLDLTLPLLTIVLSLIYHSDQHIFNVSFKEHILETYPILKDCS